MKTEVVNINPDAPEKDKIARAGSVIRRGGIVAFPTDTVYGLGADAFNEEAVLKVYKAKKRGKEKPLSIFISNEDDLNGIASEISEPAKALMRKFWPGPLTLVLPAGDKLSKTLTGNSDNIGVRIPDSKIAIALIRESKVPITSPSANISGHPEPCSKEDVLKELEGRIDMVIDGGISGSGLPSTVVDMTGERPNILREGKISRAALEKIWSEKKIILFVCTGNSCRSVIASALFKKMLGETIKHYPSKREMLSKIDVLSAGISPFPGMNAPPETLKVMQEEGIDVSEHKAVSLTSETARKSSLILVMEERHKREILNIVPDCADKIFLLKEFSKNKDDTLDISDPIGHSLEVYRECTSCIKDNIKKLMEKILNENSNWK